MNVYGKIDETRRIITKDWSVPEKRRAPIPFLVFLLWVGG